MTQDELAADYRAQLEPYISGPDLDRTVEILLIAPEQRSATQREIIRVVAGIVYQVKFTA